MSWIPSSDGWTKININTLEGKKAPMMIGYVGNDKIC